MALIDALLEWEEQWRATGAPVDRELAPGLSEDEVRAALDWLEPHPDVLTWFGWRGGLAAGVSYFELPPTLLDPMSLVGVRNWLSILQDVVPLRAEVECDPAWIPLLAGDGSRTILLHQGTGELLRFETLNDIDPMVPPILKVSDDLESLVRRWIAINKRISLTWSTENEVFEYDRAPFSLEDKRQSVVR